MSRLIRRWRRRRVLARAGIPDAVWARTLRELPALGYLRAGSLRRLRDLALLFLHEKRLEPAAGFELDDAMRTRVAVLACLPVLELSLDFYDGFVAVIVHPTEFVIRGRAELDEHGVVHVGDDVLSGEAWEQGPVVLAWDEVQASGRGDGFNVVVHEFAHKLDYLDGAMNGSPPLHRGMSAERWSEVFMQAYDDLHACIDHGLQTWLDPYAAENPAEFFAVASELFFDVPAELYARYQPLYEQLAAYYRQDPAGSGIRP